MARFVYDRPLFFLKVIKSREKKACRAVIPAGVQSGIRIYLLLNGCASYICRGLERLLWGVPAFSPANRSSTWND